MADLTVAAWNIEKLGKQKLACGSLVQTQVGKALESFDILVLIEIQQSKNIVEFCAKFVSGMPKNIKAHLSEYLGCKERMLWLYNSNRVRLVSASAQKPLANQMRMASSCKFLFKNTFVKLTALHLTPSKQGQHLENVLKVHVKKSFIHKMRKLFPYLFTPQLSNIYFGDFNFLRKATLDTFLVNTLLINCGTHEPTMVDKKHTNDTAICKATSSKFIYNFRVIPPPLISNPQELSDHCCISFQVTLDPPSKKK